MLHLLGLLFGLLIVTVSVYLLTQLLVVNTNTCVITESFGQYSRILQPGVYILHPLEVVKYLHWTFKVEIGSKASEWRRQSLREISLGDLIYDFAPIHAETLDKIPVSIDGLLFYKISNVRAAAYSTDVGRALSLWIEGGVRSAVAQHSYQDIVSRSAQLQESVFKHFEEDKHVASWGITLVNLSIQRIDTAPHLKQNLEELMNQKNTALAQKDLLSLQIEHKERELKAELDLSISRHKHGLALERSRVESEAEKIKILQGAGLSIEAILSMRQIDLLRDVQAQKIIVPHNFIVIKNDV